MQLVIKHTTNHRIIQVEGILDIEKAEALHGKADVYGKDKSTGKLCALWFFSKI